MAPESWVNHEAGLAPYVPSVAATWDRIAGGRRWRAVDGSLVFVDISGFTNLSERLANRGRIGAEELTSILNRVFGQMLEVVAVRGGSLLKFGGDALLLLFEGEGHVLQACAAAVEMRSALREATTGPTSVGRIPLKMSVGIHTGSIDFFLVGESHRELLITGPAATTTAEMEATASANEIVVSQSVAGSIPRDFIGPGRGGGLLLRKRRIDQPLAPHPADDPPGGTELELLVPRGLRQHLQSGIDDSEHRIATIGFVKFSGVDEMIAQDGPERVADVLDDLMRCVQEGAHAESVTLLATDIDADGGKIILASGVPSSRHDDEGRMLRAARGILDSGSDLSIRIGVNRGHVFAGNVGTARRRAYTVMGDTVNLAARLMAAAGSGELYSAPTALNLSTTLFRTEVLPPFRVKGKDQPVNAFVVYEETGVRPPDVMTDLPFRGRDAELEMIVGIVNTCSRVGRGGIMTISGDTGVGKSRLITEVLERCSGMETLTIQAEPSGVDNPYWAFRDPLRRRLDIKRADQTAMAAALAEAIESRASDLAWAVPLLGDVMHIDVEDNEVTAAIDPEFRPERTADALVELLSSGGSVPIAIVVEDGQWLDESSLSLIQRVGIEAKFRPWTVLVTARRESEEFEALGDEIHLRPLEDDAIRSIVIEVTAATPLRPHELEDVVAKVDGNPLFLSEILWVIRETGNADALPESLGALVAKEIDTLPPLTRHILRYASVLGRSFRRSVLDELLAQDDVHLDEATELELGQFLEPDVEGRLKFRHSVVHDAAYEGLSYRKRRELHGRAGDVIKNSAGKDLDAVVEYLANHYSAAGEWAGSLEYSLKAGAKADSLYANVQAAAHYERAVTAAQHLETSSAGEIATLREARGDALERAGLFDESLAEYAAALRVSADSIRKADLMFKRARLKAYSGNFAAGLAELTRASRPITSRSDRPAEAAKARNHSFRAVIRMMQGRPRKALALAETARTEASAADEKEALARSYMVLDAAFLTLGRASEEDYLPRALVLYEEMGDLLGAALVYNNMGERAFLEGRLDDAIELFSKGDGISTRVGNVPDAARARTNVGEALVALGRLEEARSVLEDAARVLRAHGSEVAVFADIHLARVSLATGEVSAAIESLRRALDEADSIGQSEWALLARIYLASAYRAQGDYDNAVACLAVAESGIDQVGALYAPSLAVVWAETLRDIGDTRAALDIAVAGRETAIELMLPRERELLDAIVADLEEATSIGAPNGTLGPDLRC